jgi:hypothetical protein
MAVEREADRSPDHARRLPQGALGEHPRPMQATEIPRRIKSRAFGARLAARIGFGVNGEGEGGLCRECAVFRHRFGSDERHRPMAISSNPLRSTRKSARARVGFVFQEPSRF